MDEELILSTLFSRVAEVTWLRSGDTTTYRFLEMSRRVKLWADTNEQPACFQAEWGDDAVQVSNEPYSWVLGVNWIIYQNTGKDKSAIGAIENNLILNGVRTALAPKPSDPGFHDERNTLGGLVYHCHISGRVFKDPGDLDDEGMMVVPIKILVP